MKCKPVPNPQADDKHHTEPPTLHNPGAKEICVHRSYISPDNGRLVDTNSTECTRHSLVLEAVCSLVHQLPIQGSEWPLWSHSTQGERFRDLWSEVKEKGWEVW